MNYISIIKNNYNNNNNKNKSIKNIRTFKNSTGWRYTYPYSGV